MNKIYVEGSQKLNSNKLQVSFNYSDTPFKSYIPWLQETNTELFSRHLLVL